MGWYWGKTWSVSLPFNLCANICTLQKDILRKRTCKVPTLLTVICLVSFHIKVHTHQYSQTINAFKQACTVFVYGRNLIIAIVNCHWSDQLSALSLLQNIGNDKIATRLNINRVYYWVSLISFLPSHTTQSTIISDHQQHHNESSK